MMFGSVSVPELQAEVVVLGSGGAGLLAAIHAYHGNPNNRVMVVTKGLLGKSGCTRMVQGGYNAVLSKNDSLQAHFRDTIEGGKWINNQELAWILVSTAPERVLELENQHGCFFDRNPDGTMHQKAFAGQTFDRTVHKGDLTGIEIMNRLSEQVRAKPIDVLEEHRAIELITTRDGQRITAVLLLDIRSGQFKLVRCQAVVIATGAGPTMYKFHTPSADKSCDGLALALRAGIALRDMEMIQFHPTGLLAGTDTRITGTIIEEGLRGAGGHLIDNANRRFMLDYDERGERATRDIVSRAMFEQMRNGATGPNGGVFISMTHLDPDSVRRQFRGMVKRCADIGLDLVSSPVEVTPSAHYIMGGIEIHTDCTTAIDGIFAAGEDTGGVHGANRLGGNGVGNATVFGGIAGDAATEWVTKNGQYAEPNCDLVESSINEVLESFQGQPGNLNTIRETLYEIMWERAGILRSMQSLELAEQQLLNLSTILQQSGLPSTAREFNMSWHEYLNLKNQILVSRAIVAAGQARTDSRGAHYRTDHPQTGPLPESRFTRAALKEHKIVVSTVAVEFTRLHP